MELLERAKLPAFQPRTTFVAEIDGTVTKTLRTFFKDTSRALQFPDYFEDNMDSLYDCLTSLENVPNDDVVLVIKNFGLLLLSEKPGKKAEAVIALKDAEVPGNRYDKKKFRVFGLK